MYAKSLGIQKMCYPVDKKNIASKKIPLFFSGKLVADSIKVKTLDGRILNEQIYEIEII